MMAFYLGTGGSRSDFCISPYELCLKFNALYLYYSMTIWDLNTY